MRTRKKENKAEEKKNNKKVEESSIGKKIADLKRNTNTNIAILNLCLAFRLIKKKI